MSIQDPENSSCFLHTDIDYGSRAPGLKDDPLSKYNKNLIALTSHIFSSIKQNIMKNVVLLVELIQQNALTRLQHELELLAFSKTHWLLGEISYWLFKSELIFSCWLSAHGRLLALRNYCQVLAGGHFISLLTA